MDCFKIIAMICPLVFIAGFVDSIADAWLGTNIVLLASDRLLKAMMLLVLPVVAAILLFRKSVNNNEAEVKMSSKKSIFFAALVIANGSVLYNIALPAAVFNILGNFIGSELAKKGISLLSLCLRLCLLCFFQK